MSVPAAMGVRSCYNPAGMSTVLPITEGARQSVRQCSHGRSSVLPKGSGSAAEGERRQCSHGSVLPKKSGGAPMRGQRWAADDGCYKWSSDVLPMEDVGAAREERWCYHERATVRPKRAVVLPWKIGGATMGGRRCCRRS